MKKYSILPILILFLSLSLQAQEKLNYQTPTKSIADLVDSKETPIVVVDPTGKLLLMIERPSLPSIDEVSQTELRLAGLRFNPNSNCKSRSSYIKKLSFKDIETGREYDIQGLPANAKIENPAWSPDGSKIAFTIKKPNGSEIWIAYTNSGVAVPIVDANVNAVMGTPFIWLSDSQTLIYKSILRNRGAVPVKNEVPFGPVIRETTGEEAAVRTFQDLLKNPHDERLFKYYTSSQLYKIEITQRKETQMGSPGIIPGFSSSPDGRFLLVNKIQEPFSYLVQWSRFPMKYEVWDMQGKVVREITNRPLQESLPKGFAAVSEGPRSIGWRADAPATLFWAEALDGGDPNRKANKRDKLMMLELVEPYIHMPKEVMQLQYRYGGVQWGDGNTALVSQWWWENRKHQYIKFSPDNLSASKELIFDLNFEDKYNDPGAFLTERNEYGRQVLLQNNKGEFYLSGEGASPEGNKPFLDVFNMNTKKSVRLFQSQDPYYEAFIKLIEPETATVITRRESNNEVPNYFIKNLADGSSKKLTDFQHPYPQLKDVKKMLIKYKRSDGVELSGNLYLPPFYKLGNGPIPVLIWAYPQEFKSKSAASQVTDSPNRFLRLGWHSPLIWLARGYAVLDDPGMPIVGENETEPNDTFVQQLRLNAYAAVGKLEEMGLTDGTRIAVGGHSYGAFMAANLVAHTDLFVCAIARSGAYNRTLTPFGFQSEERTFWEAPKVYMEMSPFFYADKINEPILFIHGEADNNSGTFPMQSERMFNAIKGNGGTARLVMLPHESHGYKARESIMHMFWEMDKWLLKYMQD